MTTFFIYKVATFFLTGGSGNIAKGIKTVFQSYKPLANTTGKAIRKTVTFTFDTFIKVVKKLLDFSKNIPKYVDEFKKIILEFINKLNSVVNQIFNGLEAALDLLYDLGVVISQKLDPNTGKVLAQQANGAIYIVKQNGKTILEGTEDAIRKFAQRIDEIRTSGGNAKKKVQHYLDKLAEDLSIKYSNVLNERSLKVLREKGASTNISILDAEEDIIMKGKQDDIEKYLKKMEKSNEEIISEFDRVLKIAVKSDSKRFDPLKKALIKYRNKGINILKSGLKGGTEKGRGLVPDFLHTPQYLFNADKRFGKIKIKVTGIDSDDFRLCNEAVEKFMPGFTKKYVPNGKNKPNRYTWHHMDDYDPITGECTMQLVKTKIHTACFPHKGAPGIIELFFGIARSKS
ncbi:HNH endonuclease [Tenacibaculum sp. nBUS_03]|uniref:HNH endonuclease signature motif containing protein n=1 Tax=Tenacibaculum sp. nBUS_03 TaxID=3395320 RepID=UPI003EB79B0F